MISFRSLSPETTSPRLTPSAHPDDMHLSGCHSPFAIIIHHYFCIPNWIPHPNKSCLYLKRMSERAPDPTCSLTSYKESFFNPIYFIYVRVFHGIFTLITATINVSKSKRVVARVPWSDRYRMHRTIAHLHVPMPLYLFNAHFDFRQIDF